MKNYKAFTRIDILAVVLIVVLLLAVSLPALNLPREIARRAFCAAQLKNLGIANEMYADNHDGWFVPAGYPYKTTSGYTSIRQWVKNQTFKSYLQMDSCLSKEDGINGYNAPDEFLCPGDPVSKDNKNALAGSVLQSYGYNFTDLISLGRDPYKTFYGYNRSQVGNPSEKLIITEGVGDLWLSWIGADYKIGWDVFGFSGLVEYRKYVPGGRGYGAVAYRHSEGLNILFYDSHVGYMPKEQAYIHADWDANPQRPGMWSIYDIYPPPKPTSSQ